MKSQDIVVLLKLVSLRLESDEPSAFNDDDNYSVRSIAAGLDISKSEISNSINRSLFSGLAIRDRTFGYPKANQKALYDLVTHGLKYVFPVKPGPLVRGVYTAQSAPVLAGKLMSPGEFQYVWPDASGDVLGQSIEPLFKSVPFAIKQDGFLYDCLALIDAIRLGNARESGLAIEELGMRLS